MKKNWIITLILILAVSFASAQTTTGKDSKKNLTIKEWKKPADGKSARFLDHVTKYNSKGQKVEEIEYDSKGTVTNRVVYEYGSNGKVSRQIIYGANNKVFRIRKYEYNTDGTKHKQYNYAPNGKLLSTKEFEYIQNSK